MLVLSYKVADYTINIFQTKIGYSFKIKTKIFNKIYQVAESFSYVNDFNICKQRADDQLEILMNMKSMI